ncbi:hypothetical protein PQ465_20860 [Sphingobacterium oryzagri]|uniref:Uncharacterized protein n=1 Tax=Sphingobacterium oryzagri TaxID=3025669 RepID=A0ABY7WGI2_9SPHI|nr:hypothetical protein [Sphingobacterium sp. KACC 22765]WDF68733.1 hypothetical protein PQ465_20860 [Sphingobacterium sp. KACC 22765]
MCPDKKYCPVPARDKKYVETIFFPYTNLSAARRGKAFLGRTQGSKVLLSPEGGLSHKAITQKAICSQSWNNIETLPGDFDIIPRLYPSHKKPSHKLFSHHYMRHFNSSLCKIVNASVNKRLANNVINVSSSDGKQAIDAGCVRGRYEKLLLKNTKVFFNNNF